MSTLMSAPATCRVPSTYHRSFHARRRLSPPLLGHHQALECGEPVSKNAEVPGAVDGGEERSRSSRWGSHGGGDASGSPGENDAIPMERGFNHEVGHQDLHRGRDRGSRLVESGRIGLSRRDHCVGAGGGKLADPGAASKMACVLVSSATAPNAVMARRETMVCAVQRGAMDLEETVDTALRRAAEPEPHRVPSRTSNLKRVRVCAGPPPFLQRDATPVTVVGEIPCFASRGAKRALAVSDQSYNTEVETDTRSVGQSCQSHEEEALREYLGQIWDEEIATNPSPEPPRISILVERSLFLSRNFSTQDCHPASPLDLRAPDGPQP